MEASRRAHSELARRRIETQYLIPPDDLYELAARLPTADLDAYPVTTVYLDRADGGLSRRAVESPADCVKLRVRRYCREDPHVWVEVKARTSAWIEKQRFAVPAGRWPLLLTGEQDERLMLRPCPCPPCVAESKMAFHRFRQTADRGLVTVGVVRGRRQTFRFGDLPLRMTLDLGLQYFPAPEIRRGGEAAFEPAAPPVFEEPQAVLEVKRFGLPPEWMDGLLAGFSARPYSKFRTLLRVVGFPRRRAKGLSA